MQDCWVSTENSKMKEIFYFNTYLPSDAVSHLERPESKFAHPLTSDTRIQAHVIHVLKMWLSSNI